MVKQYQKLITLIIILLAIPYPVWYGLNYYAAGFVDQVKLIEFSMTEDIRYCQKWRPELLDKDATITYYVPDKGKWVKGPLGNIYCWTYVYVTPDPRIPIFNVSAPDPSLSFGDKKPINIPPSTYPKQPIEKQMTLFEWLSKYNPKLINELKLNK